jgi:hypothetical protein
VFDDGAPPTGSTQELVKLGYIRSEHTEQVKWHIRNATRKVVLKVTIVSVDTEFAVDMDSVAHGTARHRDAGFASCLKQPSDIVHVLPSTHTYFPSVDAAEYESQRDLLFS